jgi:hypothetical protein
MTATVFSAIPATKAAISVNELSFEAGERKIKAAVLKELRGNCKTAKALQSFESFETQVTSPEGASDCRSERTVSSTYDIPQHEQKSHVSMHSSRSNPLQKPSAVQGPDSAHKKRTRPDITLPSIMGRITKSKTVGDLASLDPALESSAGQSAPRKQSTRPVITVHNRRKSSTTLASLSSSVHAKGTAVLSPNALFGHQHGSSHSKSTLACEQDRLNLTTPRRPSQCHYSSHARPPSPVPPVTPKYRDSMFNAEKASQSSRGEGRRRSSGDVMKEIWDSTVKKVKGKRVGGSSTYMSSGETLHGVSSVRS